MLRAALLLLAVTAPLVAAAQPQPVVPLPGVQFEVQRQPEGLLYRLGSNVFTQLQLSQFVAALNAFLEQAESLTAGETLVLRQDGTAGYLAVSARRSPERTDYTLTLKAEPPAPLSGPLALRSLGVRIGDQVLSATSAPSDGP